MHRVVAHIKTRICIVPSCAQPDAADLGIIAAINLADSLLSLPFDTATQLSTKKMHGTFLARAGTDGASGNTSLMDVPDRQVLCEYRMHGVDDLVRYREGLQIGAFEGGRSFC